MKDPDNLTYLRFTDPSQRDKAVNTLEGILHGIWLDGHINHEEAKELREWCFDHERFLTKAPFDEIVPKLLKALEDGALDQEEYEDIRWVLNNSKIENEYFDAITSDIQELQGIIHGITADGRIEKSELECLHDWLLEREDLKGTYPYDEIESLIVGTLQDGVIDPTEHSALLSFFHSFTSFSLSKRLTRSLELACDNTTPTLRKSGICAIDPEIIFSGKVFVFTGISERAPRKEIAEHIAKREGSLSENLSASHYLVVGNAGNPAWAFACYGRKVEKAMQLRKEGKRIIIVNEVDFWDALGD